MKKWINISFLVIFLSIGIMAYLLYNKNIDTREWITTGMTDEIMVENIQPGDVVQSPLTIQGTARGYWFFEADFPVHLQDNLGNELGWGIAGAQDDWMTEDFVPFEATLEFQEPATDDGFLILEKDNPSGLPEHAGHISIPVQF